MAPKEKMIHVRLGDDVHRDLRRAAAEEDTSIQELVSRVVSRTVEGGRLVEVVYTTEVEPGGQETVTIELEGGGAGISSVMERMDVIQEHLRILEDEIGELRRMLTRED